MTYGKRRSSCFIALLSLCAAVSLFGSAAFAGDKHRLAEQLLELMGTKAALEAQLAQMRQLMSGRIAAMLNGLSEDQAQKSKQMEDKVFELLSHELSWASMKDGYVSLYESTFSEDELQGLIRFYQSDTGRVLVAKQPQLMQKAMALSQTRMATVMPKLLAIIRGVTGKLAPEATPAPHSGASGT